MIVAWSALSIFCFFVFFSFGRSLARLQVNSALKSAVKPERSRSQDASTLGQIIADLPDAVVVFDAKNRVSSFNPAFCSLFSTDAEWLLSRPDLRDLFHMMLSRAALPAPNNFDSWIDDVEQSRSLPHGRFWQDRWTLPDGREIQVTATPHVKDQFSLRFTDISERIEKERMLMEEISLLQSALSTLNHGVSIFDRGGELAFTNEEADRLWSTQFAHETAHVSVADVIDQWQAASRPDPLWGDLRDFANYRLDRSDWTATAHLKNEEQLFIRISPLPHGALMCEFWPE